MAKSKISFYLTDIDPARNMVIEYLDSYLAGCSHSYDNIDIMYVKPDLDTVVNMAWPQSVGWTPNNNTYAKVVTDSKTYYYFVTGTKWLSEEAVQVSLHLDTANTYWDVYKNKFTDRTHIVRQHRDRLQTNGSRIVDDFDEGITPILRYVGSSQLGDTSSLWYLIYRSDVKETDSTVSCYCCTNSRILKYSAVSAPTQTLTTDDFIQDVWYYLVADDDCPTPGVGIGTSATTYNVGTNGVVIIKFRVIGTTGTFMVYATNDHGTNVSNTTTNSLRFLDTRRVYYDTSVTTPSGYTNQLSIIKAMATRNLASGSVGALYLEPISSVDRTDPQLIKVIELGYAPFPITYTSQTIDTPSGWEYDYTTGLFKLSNISTELLNPSIAEFSLSNIEYINPLVVNLNASPDPFYESKLYNSNFFSLKFGYDTEMWTFKPERLWQASNLTYTSYPKLSIEYKPSNGINSNCGFKFEHVIGNNLSFYLDELDYPGILVATRNNELPLYNNEYLNYLKYGKSYADRQTSMNIGATWLSTLLSAGGGLAAGSMIGGAPGAIIGGIVGAVSGIASAITSTVKAIDSQQQKEWEMQHQVTNVTGNSDLDIFKWYSNGKLWYFKREPTPRMRDLLFQLFFRGGYSCNEYAIPNWNSRYRFNFLQCTPSFDKLTIYQPFIDDIKKRFEAGVTIFHQHDGVWTLNYEKENWENSLVGVVNPYNIGDLTLNYTMEQATLYKIARFAGKWNGTTLDNTNQYIEVKCYDTEAAWTSGTPTNTYHPTVQANGEIEFNYQNQGLWCVSFQVIDANAPTMNSAARIISEAEIVASTDYIPRYRSAWISNLWIGDEGYIGCRLDSTRSIFAADYIQFQYFRDGNVSGTPDVDVRKYGPIGTGTHTPTVTIDPGQYQYDGAVIRARIASATEPRDTTDWVVKTLEVEE